MAALFTCNSAKASIRPKSNLSMILWLNKLSASLKKIWSKIKSLCPDNIFPIICLWETKGQVTHMQVIPTAPKSKLSNTLWLSSLPGSLMNIRSRMKIKLLLFGQLFPKSMGLSKTGNSYVMGSVNWTKVQLAWDLMPVFVFLWAWWIFNQQAGHNDLVSFFWESQH